MSITSSVFWQQFSKYRTGGAIKQHKPRNGAKVLVRSPLLTVPLAVIPQYGTALYANGNHMAQDQIRGERIVATLVTYYRDPELTSGYGFI